MVNDPNPTGRLRILETTDLHMQLLDFDYLAGRQDPEIGLIGLVDHIAALRSEPEISTLLCDNGDLIQGNPVADMMVAKLGPTEVHPMIAALNLLRYDAMTLGNHDFDFGPEFLRRVLSDVSCPVVSANIAGAGSADLAKPFVILDRLIRCNDGVDRPIKIGITGFGPPQAQDLNGRTSRPAVYVDDIVEAAHRVVPQIKVAGADIVVALCHSGIGVQTPRHGAENAAGAVAMIDGVDAVLMGHTHDAFPDADIPNTSAADYSAGTLHQTPAVMAQSYGRSLGVIDLDMQMRGAGWAIAGHNVQLLPAQAPSNPESPTRRALRDIAAEPHAAARAALRTPIARTDVPIYSYFATIQPDPCQRVLAQATLQEIGRAVSGTKLGNLPLLTAQSSFRFGGRDGQGHFVDIPAGEITLGDASAMYPYADTLTAVRRTGRQIRAWLERSAAHYRQLSAGAQDQPLIDPQSAGYKCDAIYGVTYQIDLTQPARFDTHGQTVAPYAARIKNLCYQGRPVHDDDVFLVATNSYRALGGGGFPQIAAADIVVRTGRAVRDVLIAYLQENRLTALPHLPTWSFAPISETTATFPGAAEAQAHLSGTLGYVGPSIGDGATYRIGFHHLAPTEHKPYINA